MKLARGLQIADGMRKSRPNLIIAALGLTILAPTGTGCGILAIKQSVDARKQYEQQAAEAQVAAKKAQEDAQRQIAIAQERTAYLAKKMDEQVYDVACAELEADVEKVVIKMGRNMGPAEGGMLVTDWSHVQAKYEADYWAYTVRQTQAASKSRYLVELEPSTEGESCKVEATFQYADDNGRQSSDRALDFEARLLQEVDPDKYAQIEARYESIGS